MALIFKAVIVKKRVIQGYLLNAISADGKSQVYCVTKEYGLSLAKQSYIDDTVYADNKVCGPRVIHTKIKMLAFPRIELDDIHKLGLSLTDNIPNVENFVSKIPKFKIIGCIFNNYGVIEGVRVVIGGQIKNIRVSEIYSVYSGFSHRCSKALTSSEEYNRYCWRYNFYRTKIDGGVLVFGVYLTSPNTTIELANELFGVENNILNIGDSISRQELSIRNKLLADAREIEFNIIKDEHVYKIDKYKCKYIANVEYMDINTNEKLALPLYIYEYNGKYIMYKKIIEVEPSEDLPTARVYKGEIAYNLPYEDGKELILTGISCRKVVKDNLKELVQSGKLSLAEFTRKTIPNI